MSEKVKCLETFVTDCNLKKPKRFYIQNMFHLFWAVIFKNYHFICIKIKYIVAILQKKS